MMIAVGVGAVNTGRCIENKPRGIADVVKMQLYDLLLDTKKNKGRKKANVSTSIFLRTFK